MSHQQTTVTRSPRPAVARAKPWLFCLVVLLVAGVAAASWGLLVSWRISDRPDDWPVGKAWTNPEQSVTFDVVEVVEVDQVQVGDTTTKKAPAGAVYQLWKIKVSGVLQARQKYDDIVFCSFDLLGADKAKWTHDSSAVPQGMAPVCNDESFDATGEGTLVMSYLVPRSRLGEVRGIQLSHGMMLRQPPLLRAP